MLTKQPWMSVRDGIRWEATQCAEEGLAVQPGHVARAVEIAGMGPEHAVEAERLAIALTSELVSLPARADYPYAEPDGLADIQALRGDATALPAYDARRTQDRVLGAWLGRCAGCLLGQPVEGWRRERIVGFAQDTGNWPLRGYLRSDVDEAIRRRWDIRDDGRVYGSNRINWINNVAHMPEDDDTNYTILALKLLEEYGMGFTPGDVAECWLMSLPLLRTCTAERIAYRNLAAGLLPPQTAKWHNPYREWIGAQIRGDLFGYVTPGNPALGAELAWRDASISHVKNGIYGEMWVAAMLSAAAASSDMATVLRAGLAQIPHTSRLHARITDILALWTAGQPVEAAHGSIFAAFDEASAHDWCHTIPNAMIVAAALLYGDGDLARTLHLSVVPGFDTDCNGATAGSVLGMMLGAAALPEAWVAPLHDTIISGVDGLGRARISDLARRTVALIPGMNGGNA